MITAQIHYFIYRLKSSDSKFAILHKLTGVLKRQHFSHQLRGTAQDTVCKGKAEKVLSFFFFLPVFRILSRVPSIP